MSLQGSIPWSEAWTVEEAQRQKWPAVLEALRSLHTCRAYLAVTKELLVPATDPKQLAEQVISGNGLAVF